MARPSINLDPGPEYPAHELFPVEDGSCPDVSYIVVYRYENGGKTCCPYLFSGEELQNATLLYQYFGGGKYELVARNGQKRNSARSQLTLPGPGKPLIYPQPEAEEVVDVTPAAATIAGLAPTLGGIGPILGAIAPLLISYIQGQQQAQAQQQQQTLMLFQAIMTQSQQSSREHIQSMQGLYTAQTQQMAELLKSRTPSGNESSFQDGIAFMTEFLESQKEKIAETNPAGGDDAMKTLEMMMQGMTMLQTLGGASGTPPITPPAIPNGSPS